MITAAIYQTVEFYVILAVMAAAVVALCVRPTERGPVQTLFSEGELAPGDPTAEPQIDIRVTDNGMVVITRSGLPPMGETSRVSLAITVKGFDVEIKERVADMPGYDTRTQATFLLDFMGAERYHVSYSTESENLFTAFTLAVRPGLHINRPLKR